MAKCANCEKENRLQARHCRHCGKPLAGGKAGLDDLVGLEAIKNKYGDLIKAASFIHRKNGARTLLSAVVTGPTGSGKTRLIEVLSRIFHEEGLTAGVVPMIIDSSQESDLSEKGIKMNFDAARGGVLCIDNADRLVPQGSSGLSALDRIGAAMERSPNDPIVFVLGHNLLCKFAVERPDFKKHFLDAFTLKDYTTDELCEICRRLFLNRELTLDPAAAARVRRILIHEAKIRSSDFSNGIFVKKNLVDPGAMKYYNRGGADSVILASDIDYDLPPEVTLEQALAELDGLIGMESIKKEIRDLANSVKVQKERCDAGLVGKVDVPHIILTGNPGTGKTTLARLLGQVMMAIGVLPTPEVVETSAGDFVAGHVGQTSVKTKQLLEKSVGKVLFIDEAYRLTPEDGGGADFNNQAVAELMMALSSWSGRFMCIAAGYRAEMDKFIAGNKGNKRRFEKSWHIDDYTPPELHAILRRFAEKDGYRLSSEAATKAELAVVSMHERRGPFFGNAGEVENLWKETKRRADNRLLSVAENERTPEAMSLILPQDIAFEPPKDLTLDEVMSDLDVLIGMEPIKKKIRALARSVATQKRLEKAGQGGKVDIPHIILTGNPGTGKTTLARMLGKVMKAVGVLPSDEVVEVSAKDLVAGHVGQTNMKADSVVRRSLGRILFIDEAYRLTPKESAGGFNEEAVSQVMQSLTAPEYQNRFMCIAAGYRAEMEGFVDVNPGMARRFPERWHIEDYGPGELHCIFRKFAEKEGYVLSKEADEKARETVRVMHEDRDPDRFGNAGDVENVWRKAKERHGNRISALPDAELKKEILPEDVP